MRKYHNTRPETPTTGGEQRDLDEYRRIIDMSSTEAGREQLRFEIEDIKAFYGWKREMEENIVTFFGGQRKQHVSDIQYHGGMFYNGEW